MFHSSTWQYSEKLHKRKCGTKLTPGAETSGIMLSCVPLYILSTIFFSLISTTKLFVVTLVFFKQQDSFINEELYVTFMLHEGWVAVCHYKYYS